MSNISIENQHELDKFWDWMERTDRARIFSFEASGKTLYSLIDSDPIESRTTNMISVLSSNIESFINTPDDIKKYFRDESDPRDWSRANSNGDEGLYACYRIFKTLWLARDIREKDRQEAPVQLIQTGRNYHFHPGSDKKHVITLLQPLESVRCFYIWYPELDPAPWVWTQPYEEIKNQEDFINLFDRVDHGTFKFEHGTVTFNKEDWASTRNHFKPFAAGALKACRKYGKMRSDKFHLELEHLSYHDAVHRMGMYESTWMIDDIYLENEHTFMLGDFKFIKIDGTWMPEKFLNKPTSLVDSEWRHDPDRAIFFNNTRPNIGLHRLNQ